MNSQHPTDELLLGFAVGQLTGDDRDTVELHVSSCERCARRVETLPTLNLKGDGYSNQNALDAARSESTEKRYRQPEETLPADFASKDRLDAQTDGNRPGVHSFGDYEILEEIARGGMGVIYKARQISLGRTVALKMILAGQLAGEEEVQRFRSEAEAAALLDHPAIVPIHEVGEHGGQHFFSMAFVSGTNLSDKIKAGPLPCRQAAQYAKNIAEAMAYSHAEGVIHRDLKPANVLLDASDQPRVTDFGLAKRVKGDSGLTATGQILGTPSYMSPEQATGRMGEVAEASDVYSLGATLYALVTARPPFQGESHVDTIMQVQELEPVSPRMLNNKVPKDLETICLKCLQKEPSKRYSTAAELGRDLDRFLNGKPIAARPISAPARAWRWCKRNPTVASLATGLVVTLWSVSVGVSVLYIQSAKEADRNRRALYSAHMNDAFDAWNTGDHARVRDLLDRQRPRSGQEDLRQFEWRVLDQLYEDFDSAQVFHFNDKVRWIAVDDQGKQLAVLQEDGGLSLVGLSWGETRRLLEPDQVNVTSNHTAGGLAFSPEGDRLFVGGQMEGNHAACTVDLVTGELTYFESDDNWNGQALALSHNGSAVAVGGIDPGRQPIRVWNAETGQFLSAMGGDFSVTSIAMAPSQVGVLAAGHHSTAGITIWDWMGREKRTTIPSQATITTLDFSSDGRLLAHAGWRRARIWDVSEFPPVQIHVLETTSAAQVCFSPSGQLLACAQVDGLVSVWDVETGRQMHQFSHSLKANTVAFSPDERHLLSGSWDKTVRVWPLNDRGIENVSDTFFHVMDINEQSGHVIVATKKSDPTIILWHPESGKMRRLPLDNRDLKRDVAISPDGDTVAFATMKGDFELRSVKNGTITRTLNAQIQKTQFGLEGEKLVAVTTSGLLQVWDWREWEVLMEVQLEAWEQYSNVEFTHDGRFLVIGGGTSGKRGGVHVWDMTGKRPTQRATMEHDGLVEDLSISMDDRFIAAADMDGVTIWNVETQSKEIFIPCGYTGSVTYSPDQETLVVGVRDGIQFWNSSNGDPRGAIRFRQPVIGVRFLDDETLVYIERFVGAGILKASPRQ